MRGKRSRIASTRAVKPRWAALCHHVTCTFAPTEQKSGMRHSSSSEGLARCGAAPSYAAFRFRPNRDGGSGLHCGFGFGGGLAGGLAGGLVGGLAGGLVGFGFGGGFGLGGGFGFGGGTGGSEGGGRGAAAGGAATIEIGPIGKASFPTESGSVSISSADVDLAGRAILTTDARGGT